MSNQQPTEVWYVVKYDKLQNLGLGDSQTSIRRATQNGDIHFFTSNAACQEFLKSLPDGHKHTWGSSLADIPASLTEAELGSQLAKLVFDIQDGEYITAERSALDLRAKILKDGVKG